MNDKGDIYFRDVHGNFHKLSTKQIANELDDFLEFDNILLSDKFSHKLCLHDPLNYYSLNLKKIKGSELINNMINLKKGLYRFFIYLTLKTKEDQRIYFFFRNNNVFEPTLMTDSIYKNIPNNLNYNMVFNINSEMNFDIAIISEKPINSINSYIMFVKIN